jgi:hypothetical protein
MRNFVRSIAVAAALVAPLSVASAQKSSDGSFGVGTRELSVGLLGGSSGNYGIGAGAAFEVGVKELAPNFTLGLGAFVGFTSKSEGVSGYSYTARTIPIAAVGNVHYKLQDQPKLDLYGGLNVGFVHYSFSSSDAYFNGYNYGSSSDLALGVDIGARYDFAPKVAGFVQLSGGSAFPLYFVGLTFKM